MTIEYSSQNDGQPFTLSERCVQVAAGVPVNADAYTRWDLNLMRVQTMGRAFARGWLHNVLGRITPMTAYAREDYLAMADLFITTKQDAQALMVKLNKDMAAFAAAAGYYATPQAYPKEMADHVALYRGIGGLLEQKFDFEMPRPFASGGTVTADAVRQAEFIREFMAHQA